jgi:CRP/FNR family transcriptional regulator
VPIFSSLNKEELMCIADLINHKVYKKGEIIIHEGEKSNSITIISDGSAKACRYSLDGKEQILYIFSEGDFFGERNLLNERTSTYTIKALTQVRVCTLSKDEFQPLLYNHPDISIKILSELSERMYRLENAMQGMGIRNVDYRISTILLELSEKYGSKVKEGILIQMPLSREGIANYLGVARETVSRKLGQLESDGIIRSINNKSILILEPDTLKEATGS